MDKLSESATTPRNNDPTPNFSNTAMPAQTPPQHGVQNTPTPNKWTVHVCPTTGGQFDIQVSAEDSIDNIKKCISKRLKISKERISLLHKERYANFSFIHSTCGCMQIYVKRVQSARKKTRFFYSLSHFLCMKIERYCLCIHVQMYIDYFGVTFMTSQEECDFSMINSHSSLI